MGEKVNDAQVTNLLALIAGSASPDAKVAAINQVKSGIKQNNVPETCIANLFEIARQTTTSSHAAVANAGMSTLNHLLTRLSRQEPKYVVKEAGRTLPVVIEKLGDPKDKFRMLANQCLTTLWRASSAEVERAVKNTAMSGKNSRGKESALQWLVEVRDLLAWRMWVHD